jgi:Zn finger protein HypA/HybF involved in hydrogenase expression
MNLADLLIVSECLVSEDASGEESAAVGHGGKNPGLHIAVAEASGVKCPRCWKQSRSTNADGLCPRCAAVMAKREA